MSEKRASRSRKPSGTSKASKPPASGSPMDLGLLEQIVKLMSAHELTMVDVQDGDKRVVLKRGPEQVAMPAAAMPAPMYAPAPALAHAPAPTATPAAPAAAPSEDAGLIPIKSPMVGTFYAAPSPDAKPFVSVGSVVDEETDVCVIEAMKVFNNIKAECRGTIAKVIATNGQSVEFGQTLFLVKPS